MLAMPKYAGPPSQSTAPVHEFRCLYTHDIQKKQKKWHDGSCRFHTFNRRVMVYDDAKNFVGDLHYRGDDAFGEGSEVRLDRPVLVEVGELIGKTQTDLTELLDRGRTEQEGSSAHVPTRPVQRANAAGHPAARSLKEMLAASQGRRGCLRQLQESLYEQKQGTGLKHPLERPAKRQRTAPEKENEAPSAKGQFDSTQNKARGKARGSVYAVETIQKMVQCQQIVTHADKSTGRMPRVSTITDMSAEEERPVPTLPQLTNKKQKVNESDSRTHRRTSGADLKQHRMKPLSDVPTVENQTSSPYSSAFGSERPTEVVHLKPHSDNIPKSVSHPGTGSLKFATKQPRKKLLYKALLPPFIPKDSTEEGRTPHRNEVSACLGTKGREAYLTPDLQRDNTIAVEVASATPLVKACSNSSNDTVRHGCERQKHKSLAAPVVMNRPDQRQSLFISQESSIGFSSPEGALATTDAFEIPSLPANVAPPKSSAQATDRTFATEKRLNSRSIPIAEAMHSETTVLPPLQQRPKPFQETHQSHAPKKSPLLGSVALSPSVIQSSIAALPPPSKTDYQVTPGHDALLEAMGSTMTVSGNEVTADLSVFVSPRLARRRSPKKQMPSPALSRSVSDTAAFVPGLSRSSYVAGAPMSTDGIEEQGPWTKMEAYLLFDDWPASKRHMKPVFEKPKDLAEIRIREVAGVEDQEQMEDEETITWAGMNAPIGRNYTGFRSARVIRDAE